MSSDESSSSLEFQECILKCEEAKQFFNFPTKAIMRNVWLYKLGIQDDDYYPHPSVCDRHFSAKMFDSDKKLNANAVPDRNLPTDLLVKSTKERIKTIVPIQPGRRRNAGKKMTKIIEISKLSNKSPPNTNPDPLAMNTTNTQAIANTSSTQSWIDDSSNILVDYQLKVRGKQLCDVIEIPQFIVVFTVVKTRQDNVIKLSDIQNKKKKPNTAKRPALKNLPKPTAFITIDDDVDDVEVLPESRPTATVQPKPLEIVQPELPAIHTESQEILEPEFAAVQTKTLLPVKIKPVEIVQPAQTKPLQIVQPELPAVQTKHLEIVLHRIPAVQTKPLQIVQPELPAVQIKHLEIELQGLPAVQTKPLQIEHPEPPVVQTKPLEIIQPELPAVIPQKSKRKPKPEPEIDIVYYTTDEGALPRRDRSVQVDLSNKRRATGIQCDVQLDNDIREMSCNAELCWLQSPLKMINSQINLDECLVCGEILSNHDSKVRHAHGHEASPSLCSQCGDIFDSRIKLKVHEKTFHTNNLNPWKPQRCPKRNCNKAFRSKNLLINHIEEHIGTKQHKCNKCLQLFSSSMKLSCHQRALDKCLRTRGWTSRRWTKRI